MAESSGRPFRFTRLVAPVAVIIVAVVLVAVVRRPGRTLLPGMQLIAGTDFTLGGALATSLVPGVESVLPVTATNAFTANQINVNQITVAVSSVTTTTSTTVTTTCDPASYLTIGGVPPSTPITGLSTVVQAGASVAIPLPIVLAGNAPNGCQAVTFNFTYSGVATYTGSTATALSSSATAGSTPGTYASTVGQAGSLTATVTAAHTPVGTVTFSQCTSPALAPGSMASSCTSSSPLGAAVPFTSTTATTGTATFSTAGLAPGVYVLFATFTPTLNSGFDPSSSTTVTQTVNVGSCGPAISTVGATVINYAAPKGNYEVANGHTLYVNGGSITGNVTVDPTGQLTAVGGSVSGNIQSSGGPISLQGTTVGGNVQSTNGVVALGAGTKVGGNVQPTGGAATCSMGTSTPVQIGGNFQIQSMPSTAGLVGVCGTQVGGNLMYQGNAVAATFGGYSVCLGDTVGGNLQIQSNTGQLTIGAPGYGNTVKGNILVQSNTKSSTSTLRNNGSGGNCLLQGDSPGIVGSGNTAGGQNLCNTSAAGA